MLYLTADTKIFLVIEPVNFRKQMDGLIALCMQQQHNPRSGHFFVFINRARTMIRVLCYDGSGYWLATKRLSRGHYNLWPKEINEQVSERHASELTKILKSFVVPERKNRYISQQSRS